MIRQGPPSDAFLFKAYLPFIFWNSYMNAFFILSLIGGLLIGFSDYEDIILSSRGLNVQTADGRISDSWFSGTEEFLFWETEYYGFKYHFNVDGKDYEDKSYAEIFPENVGKHVIVNYLISNPKISVIDGMTGGPLSKKFLIVGLIFAAFGFIILAARIRKIAKQIYILRNGIIFKGTFLREVQISSKKISSLTHNIFEYRYNGKTYEIGLDRLLFLTNFKEGDKAWMVHHKDYPEKVLVVSNLPKILQRNFLPLD